MRVALSLLLLLFAAQASAEEWQMHDESEFLFEASWEETPLPGRFDAFDVHIESETGLVNDATLTVTVDLTGADMGDPDINEGIAGEEWFAVAEFPQAVYRSDSITETAPGEYVAMGELALKGVTRSIDVPFTWSSSAETSEMSGELTIDRTQFAIGSGEWADDDSIGTDVHLKFKILFVRQ